MNRAKKCCFCISLKIGCIIFALIGLCLSITNIEYIMILHNTHVLHACLQIFAELLSFFASILMIFAVLSQYYCIFWTIIVFQVIKLVYLISYSIISTSLGKNVIVNESLVRNIIYWVYIVFTLAKGLYFIYITCSYYRKLKEEETENIV
ncbi:hypothetical protein KR032_010549 [Drosophila birchii]|nr:hypothetical protein KR032_010549 [Drosophila birchii]